MNVQAAINAGLFVNFVYNTWNSAGSTTNLDGMPVVTAANAPIIPGKKYDVLKTIYANDLATDLNQASFSLATYKTIGIVAANAADPADIYIAIRGTEGIWEWVQDAKFFPKPFTKVHGAGLTEDGFTDMYDSFSLTPANNGSDFVTELLKLLPTNAMVTITGHSLGAALATLLSLDMAAHSNLPIGIYTLASPRVGDLSFERLFNHVVPNAYRIANRMDIVPKLPPPLFYFHVGDETELTPGNTLKFTLPCEHHLTSYLNLLATLINQASLFPLDADCQNAAASSADMDV